MRRVMASAVAIVMLVVGCSDTSAGSDPPGGTAPPQDTVTSGEPQPEPTDPESTQTKQNQPAISLATAPIGGNPDEAGIRQCTAVAWLAGEIPDGTTVTLGAVTLEPGNVFKLDQQVCSNDRQQCTGLIWKPDSTETCYVGAEQIAPGDGNVKVVVAAEVKCATEQDCQAVKEASANQGTQVFFIPGEFPAETVPTETPETPTGG